MIKSHDELFAERKEHLFQKSKLYATVFGTAEGKKVLQELVDLYVRPESFSSDPLKMARNVAKCDLVKYIKEMVEMKNNE